MNNSPLNRSGPDQRRACAFTLVELLVVFAVISILAALLMGGLNQAKPKAQRVVCLNNLRQIGFANQSFAHEHNGAFPARVTVSSGGVKELMPSGEVVAEVFEPFVIMSVDLVSPKLLICPTDTRSVAGSFAVLKQTNISYFTGLQATPIEPGSVLSGDRNVRLTDQTYHWTTGLHELKGNLLFADAHVEQRVNWTILAPSVSPGENKKTNEPLVLTLHLPQAVQTVAVAPTLIDEVEKSQRLAWWCIRFAIGFSILWIVILILVLWWRKIRQHRELRKRVNLE